MSRRSSFQSFGVALLAAVLCLSSLMPSYAAALDTKSSNAIRVSPALSNIQLSSGETSRVIKAQVNNLTSVPLTVMLGVKDFSASAADPGRVSFYGNSYDPATNPHGLQSAVSFISPSITLAPKSGQTVDITLNSLDRLAPGGHYGAITFSPVPFAAAATNTKVTVHSSVASLIFLTTASGGTQALQLLPQSVGPIRFNLPGTALVAFKDAGNTQSAPQGQLTLYGPSGSIVGTTVLNPGGGLILPGTSRPFTAQLPLQHTWLDPPGMYRMELQYRDPAQNSFTVVNERFLYVNLWLIVPVLIILALAIYLVLRYARRLARFIWRGYMWLSRLLHRKKKAEEPPKPKRSRPLIQG